MSDDDFWEHVFTQEGLDDEDDYNPDHGAMDDFLTEEQCSICGAVGACAWDAQGYPLIHPVSNVEYYEVHSGDGTFLRLLR
jgi:hypothetical protein